MSILDRILGRTPTEGPQIQASRSAPRVVEKPIVAVKNAAAGAEPPAVAADERVVRVYDQFGRTVTIGPDAWRRDVLLPNLAANREPGALADLIASALGDDFAADVLDSARWLADHDPQPRRGALLLGAVLLQLRDFPAARDLLRAAIARHGEDAYLLANLARAEAALGDAAGAQTLMWRALQLDPNEASTLDWLIAMVNANGRPAVLEAYARAAALI